MTSLHPTAQAWLSHLEESGASQNTLRAYRRAVEAWERHLAPHATPLWSASVREVQGWMEAMGRRLSPATVNQRFSAMIGLYDWAQEWGYVRENPFRRRSIVRPRVDRQASTARPLSLPEIRRIWWVLGGTDEDPAQLAMAVTPQPLSEAGKARDRALFRFLVYTGRRPGEMAHLRWGDIEEGPAGGYLLNGREPVQALPAHVYHGLVAWYRAAGWQVAPAAYLWRRLHTAQIANLPTVQEVDPAGPISPAQVSNLVRSMGKRAGVNISAATLRHTFAALFHGTVGDVEELARILGHRSLVESHRFINGPAMAGAVDAYSAAFRAVVGF